MTREPDVDPPLGPDDLVAYLDGEVDAQTSQKIERCLAEDPQLVQRMREHQLAWDFLDELPCEEVSDNFTRTTLQMVAVAATNDAEELTRDAEARRSWLWLVAGGSLIAASLAGFWAAAILFDSPNRKLLQDLPVIENLEAFQQVESVEFLRALENEGLFSGLLVGVGASVVDEVLAQRRARIGSMTAAEKEELRRNYPRFTQLDQRERQELRDLHEEIATSPDSERLTSVMRLYHEWLQSLTAGERLQLLDLPADQRMRAIKQLIERQERDRFQALVQKTLSVEDREAIVDWLAELALKHLPAGEQQRLAAIDQPLRRRMEIMAAFRRRADGMNDARFWERLKPTVENRSELVARLSPSAQDTIAATKDDSEKRLLVQSWVNAAIFSRRGSRPSVPQEALDEFFANLDAADKDYLNNLPPDRQREELEQLFMRHRLRRPGDSRPPLGPNIRRRGPLD